MVTVSLASIIVAVVSLVGAVGAAALVAYTTCWSDERKRRTEAAIILSKYQDPLLLAASALRHKILGLLVGTPIPDGGYPRNVTTDYHIINTAYLVGQFFAWVYILRVESQFLTIQRSHKTKMLTRAFFEIEEAWSTDSERSRFMLWRGQQSAIGELMTVIDSNGQRSCVGYARFRERWYSPHEPELKQWFGDFRNNSWGGSKRLKRVASGLKALIEELDPKGDLMAAYSRFDEEDFPTPAGTMTVTSKGTGQWPVVPNPKATPQPIARFYSMSGRVEDHMKGYNPR
jgi:hypothetical protein